MSRLTLVIVAALRWSVPDGASAQIEAPSADRALARDIRRDLILMLTGDEETAGSCIAWLVNQHRDLIDAEFALNTDAGGGVLREGRRVMFAVQASEKVYATYVLEATDKGGHSSLPRPADNPVYRLAPLLQRLAQYQFPVKLNEVSRAFFERSAALETGPLAEDMRGVR